MNAAGGVLTVSLPTFEGPLDLLYYLIRKHELEISEISLAVIADEFVAMVEAAAEPDLSTIGGALVIAATLMYLKSKWLLPAEENPEDQAAEEAVGPLLQRLMDLEKLREVAHELALKEDRARATYPRPLTDELERRLNQLAETEPFIDVSAYELLKAMRRIQDFAFPAVRSIVKEEIRLEDKIEELFAFIRVRTRISLTRMFEGSRSVLEAVVFFMAGLELAKQKALRLKQTENFGEIEASLREDHPMALMPADGSS